MKSIIIAFTLVIVGVLGVQTMPMGTQTLTALSVVVFPAYATQDEEQGDEEECQLMDAPQLGEGWQRKVCPNSDNDSWISPNGEECFANPEFGTTRCGEGPGNPPIQVQ
jgi:hypothetical protein